MLKTLILTLIFSITVISHAVAVNYYTFINGGSSGFWANANTWTTDPSGLTLTGSAVPANNDNVTILNGYTVTLNANVTQTGLTININSGGTLNIATFTFPTIATLNGAGTLRIGAGYFPVVTNNNFASTSGATVEYYDFTGSIPVSINYPNLTFRNSTSTNHVISFLNTASYSATISGNLTTLATGTGTLAVALGTQATNVISLTNTGNITVGLNTTLRAGVFNAIHNLTVLGNFTNNGTVDFSNSAQYSASNNGAVNLNFTGTTNNILACNGITDLYTLVVNKGSASTYTLSVTSTNTANLNFFSNGILFTVTNGTLRLGSNISIPQVYGSGSPNYDVGSSTTNPTLWVDGATINSNGSPLVVYGTFRITAGSFTTTGGQGSVIREEGSYQIEGGTFTTEKFRPSSTASTHRGSFIMSGGTFNALGTTGSDNNYARFSHPYPEQVFIMSGGTINVSNPVGSAGANNGGIHIGCKESNYTVTGGTFNAILSGSAQFYNISSTVPFWNLTISRTGGTPVTARLTGIGSIAGTVTAAQPLTVLNDFTIEGTNTPGFDANDLDVTIGGDFVIQSGATYIPDNNITRFNGAPDQLFSNSGTITSGLYILEVDKATGRVTLGGSATSFSVINYLNLLNGILDDGGKTLLVSGNLNIDAVHTGIGSITLNGTATQSITGNDDGILGNVVVSNNATPAASLSCNLTISGILTLAGTGNALFDINEFKLAITSPSTSAIVTTGNPFSNTKMIRTLGFQSDQGVEKTYGNLSPFTFPIGAGSLYSPATVQLTAAPTTYGTITIRPVNSRHPLVAAGNTNNLTRYWKVTSASFAGLVAGSVSHIYTYPESNVAPPGDDVNYVPARYNPTQWTVINNVTQVNETTNQISFTNVDYINGEFTAGIPSSFSIVRIFYSKRNGNWNDVGAGTTPWSNVSHTGADATVFPTAGDQVYIGDGATNNHTLIITANNQASGGLEISAGSTLDVSTTTGHNFGSFDNTQIGGSGTLRISSAAAVAEFPAGDFGNFIRSSGGTVVYYSTGTQDFTLPTVSAAPTNLPLVTYKNLTLIPGTGRFIRLPALDLTIYDDMSVQGASATGVVRINSTSSRTLSIEGDLLINSGNLQFQNVNTQNIEVFGNLSIGTGAIFNHVSSGSPATNQLSLYGNLVNNGTLDLSNTTSWVTNTIFYGAYNSTVTGTGATTDFNIITVSKGISQSNILDVNATAFTLSGTSPALILIAGTFRLTSSQTITVANNVDFSIPSAARLSANGGTMAITGAAGIDVNLSGTLEVINGTINVGTTVNDNSIEYAATGTPTINVTGGTLNVHGQIRRSSASAQGNLTYLHSGTAIVSVGLSSVTTTTRGVFEILNPGSNFTMSGGTLRIIRPLISTSIADIYIQPASGSATGGTIEIGTGVTSQTIDLNTTLPLYNLTVTGTTNTARLEFNTLTLNGSLDIQAANIFNANSLNVFIAGNMTNSNPTNTTGIAVGGYRPGSTSQTTTFNSSSGNQIITGATGNLTNFGNLVIINSFAGGSVTLQPNTSLRVNGSLTLTSGILAGEANTITVIGTVSNSSTHTSSGAGNILLAGTGAQVITGNGLGKFGNFTLNNASGAVFTANQEITGTLTFSNGLLNIGSYLLNLSGTGFSTLSGSSAARYIVTSGNLSDQGIRKSFAASASGTFIFPIGVSGKYTPATYTFTAAGTPGVIDIKPVNSKHPNATGPGTAFINYFWNVAVSGMTFSSVTHTYTYVVADESGLPASYRDARFQGGAWTVGVTTGNPNTTTRVITFTNTDLTGDYTAGEATAFVNPTTYTSIATGSWESDLSVWDIDPPGTNLGPPAGSFVIISEGTTITVTTNNKRTATLELRGRLHLGNTTGHDFGAVSTAGPGDRTLQLQSSTFPSGNFSTFNAANGGTVNYNGLVTLPTQATYNNLLFTSTGTKTLSNANLTINGNLTINAGIVDNSVNNASITLSSSGDFTNQGGFINGNGTLRIGRDLLNTGASASFNAGNGSNGLVVGRNLINSSSAAFISGTDSLRVNGFVTNEGTFNGNAGNIRVGGNVTNTSGTFSISSGTVTIGGTLTNNATFSSGSGNLVIGNNFINSGGSATYNGSANTTVVNGNFSINNGTVNAGSGTWFIGGNWVNLATFSAGTSTVAFSRNGAQSFTGSTTFYNLSRQNGGTLNLNNDVTVTNFLTLTSGTIVTGSNTVGLTNTSIQPVTGYSSASYVDGRMSISYPNTSSTSRTYPVGKGTIYRPVTIQQTAASVSPLVRVEMINTPPTGSYPVAVGILSEARYYSIDLLSGTMNSPTIELNFNTNGFADESVLIPANAKVLKSSAPSGPWTDEGGSGVFSPASPAGYVTSGVTSISNPSYFTLGYQSSILPVTLGKFSGTLFDGKVFLEWKTFLEKNNDYFAIQRSSTEFQFDSIGYVAGAGTTLEITNYNYVDENPYPGRGYYRLKQVDIDGTASYSPVVTVLNSADPILSVHPNPANDPQLVIVKLYNVSGTGPSLITLSDAAGKMVGTYSADLSTGVTLEQLTQNTSLKSGLYTIKVLNGKQVFVRKLILY